MSAIKGIGHGSNHNWKKEHGPIARIKWDRHSKYTCEKCGESFLHEYHLVPDIFIAMQQEGISKNCKFAILEEN